MGASAPSELGCPLCVNSGHCDLFNYLIGTRDERQGNRHTERLGGSESERHVEGRWLNDRQLSGLLAFENPPNVNACLVPCVGPAGTVANQTSRRCEL